MATLILSAVGTAIGGPLGGSIGAVIGSQIDRAVFKPGSREGARLKELRVTASTYGEPIPRHFGKIRSAGTIVWSTDLVESTEKRSGGKGQPSVTTASYAVSFAVALASRPILGIGRIWADGNLLRGAEGDLKVGGSLRIYDGYGDQQPDPLLASALGAQCPAFRGTAYCVFESLQLAEFSNRFPALTFEILADEAGVALRELIQPAVPASDINRPLPNLVGFSDNGGGIAANLDTIDQVYPLTCDATVRQLSITAADAAVANPVVLPEAAADPQGDSFATLSGESRRRQVNGNEIPEAVRYYDLSRDYQAGLQRADGRARAGRSRILEFPGALEAEAARDLANKAAERAAFASERLSWRLPELDCGLSPGMVVRVPRRAGLWRIEEWEWRETGVELQLLRLPHGSGRQQAADSGTIVAPADLLATPTFLLAVELPWDGQGSGTQRQVVAAGSSIGAGWTGAALYSVSGEALQPIGSLRRDRAVLGQLVAPLAPGSPIRFAPDAACEIELVSPDLALTSIGMDALTQGGNRAVLGEELIQFLGVERIGTSRWRLRGLLRGRGGTESRALVPHAAGTPFLLIPAGVDYVDAAALANAATLAALGLVDPAPVESEIIESGRTTRPLMPVHGRRTIKPDGAWEFSWVRRARAGWEWRDLVDLPLNEDAERYLVGVGDLTAPSLQWAVNVSGLLIEAGVVTMMQADHLGKNLWVRQIGSHGASDPLLLHTLN